MNLDQNGGGTYVPWSLFTRTLLSCIVLDQGLYYDDGHDLEVVGSKWSIMMKPRSGQCILSSFFFFLNHFYAWTFASRMMFTCLIKHCYITSIWASVSMILCPVLFCKTAAATDRGFNWGCGWSARGISSVQSSCPVLCLVFEARCWLTRDWSCGHVLN